MPTSLRAVSALLVLLFVLPAAGARGDHFLRSLRYLPQDALYAASTRMENLGILYDRFLELAGEFLPEEQLAALQEPLQQWEQEVGLSLREDLLGLLGGEVAFAVAVDDLDRIGITAMTLQSGREPDLEPVLGGIVLVVGVEDADRFDASLAKLLALNSGRLDIGVDGERAVRVGGEERPVVRYRHDGSFLVAGLTRGAVQRALSRAAGDGASLLECADFDAVFARLDPDPTALAYVNLPRLQQLLRDSNLVQSALATQPELDRLYQKFVVQTDWPSGAAWANYPVPGGSVQQTFLPVDLGELAQLYAGAVGAIAVPNLLNAFDRGRQRRTMADIRSIATAVEAYAVDHNRYPANVLQPTPVADPAGGGLAALLVPVYIREIPAQDAWGHPIYYQSDADGREYRLFSYGKDGQRTSGADGPQEDLNGDIVFRNGVFIRWPVDVEP